MFAQNARVQIIHNCADPVADTVNIYLDNAPLLTDFAFRSATAFTNVQAGAPITLSVLPKGETDTANAVFSTSLTLTPNEAYVIVASGIVDTASFASKEFFSLEVYAGALETSQNPGSTSILIHHGSPDAPGVDVEEVGVMAGTTANNLSYPDFQPYIPFITLDYILRVYDSTQTVSVGEYLAPLQTLNLADSAAVVLASGFLNTLANPGPSFVVLAILPNGQILELPQTTANVQIIHNSPDILAGQVDIWVNTQKALSNVAFRTATSYLPLPANADFTVSILPGGSSDTAGAVYKESYNLMRDSAYLIVATGLIDPSNYSVNEPFELVEFPARQSARVAGNTDVLVYHGAPDAPAVDVNERTVPVTGLIDSLVYGDFVGYLPLVTADYELEIAANSDQSVVAVYSAPLSTLNLQDSSLVVLASGFLDTVQGGTGNPINAPEFGLWVALPGGGNLIPLPVISGLGDQEGEKLEDIAVYPNPASGFLNIINPTSDAGVLEIEVMSMNGVSFISERWQAESGSTYTLQIDTLPQGLYLVRLTDENQNQYLEKVLVR